MPIWNEVSPLNLPKGHQGTGWIFADYWEFPQDRNDGKWRRRFLFRNASRTLFGVLEIVGDEFPTMDCDVLARKVLNEEDYRNSLLNDDAELPKLWKRH